MEQYHTALKTILEQGTVRPNRTGTDTIGVFGLQSRYPLADGFPLVTTKKVFWSGVVHELLWFLRGETNIRSLVEAGVNIWNDWPLRHYNKSIAPLGEKMTMPAFVERIKTNSDFAKQWGELGPVYGSQWRCWRYADTETVQVDREGWGSFEEERVTRSGSIDQISKLMHDLEHNPYGRRHIVTAWNPAELEEMEVSGLPPCHCLFQFNCREVSVAERWKHAGEVYAMGGRPSETAPIDEQNAFLDRVVIGERKPPRYYLDCQLYQRSCDFFLGVPFNIAGYALLTHMIAHQLNMIPGDFVHTYGDAHIYVNHLDQVREQLQRELRPLPTLEIADYDVDIGSRPPDIFSYQPEMFMLKGYNPHPPIAGKIAV